MYACADVCMYIAAPKTLGDLYFGQTWPNRKRGFGTEFGAAQEAFLTWRPHSLASHEVKTSCPVPPPQKLDL
eukprot:scaffold190376_cov35-Tisochrysis_lutea.AAC.1